jgi:hypothetical protein
MKPPGGFEGIVIKSGEYCKEFEAGPGNYILLLVKAMPQRRFVIASDPAPAGERGNLIVSKFL